MKRKLLGVLAAMTMLATVAAPASAAGPTGGLAGDMDLRLYLYTCPNEDAPGRLLSWAGTVDFGRRTVGIAFFPTAELQMVGDTGWVYFEENWTLFRLPNRELTPKAIRNASCNPNPPAGVRSSWACVGLTVPTASE